MLRKWRGTSGPRFSGLPRRASLNIDRLLGILHAVDEGIVRVRASCARRQISSCSDFDARLRFRPDAALQAPAAEHQHAAVRLARSGCHHGVGIVVIFQFAQENLGPEVILLFRQALAGAGRSPGLKSLF